MLVLSAKTTSPHTQLVGEAQSPLIRPRSTTARGASGRRSTTRDENPVFVINMNKERMSSCLIFHNLPIYTLYTQSSKLPPKKSPANVQSCKFSGCIVPTPCTSRLPMNRSGSTSYQTLSKTSRSSTFGYPLTHWSRNQNNTYIYI